MARPERFELPTSWFVAMRSIQLSYGRIRERRAIISATLGGVKEMEGQIEGHMERQGTSFTIARATRAQHTLTGDALRNSRWSHDAPSATMRPVARAFSRPETRRPLRTATGAVTDMSNRDTESATKTFRGWRLIGAIMCVIVVLAIVSAVVDWVVIGPLEGRMF